MMKRRAGGESAPNQPQPEPFWRTKAMEDMTAPEWESLCDGCARCCLNKLEDEDTGAIHFTSVACTLLDGETCRCTDYD
ncbi:YkgJ family cysteine cluster protein, partial [Enterobacter ludwigii]|uniref:YkgJ family cysteine cluster protein n=1 Tax=Enterobacter ludwigii TaxID=299767 RepID=UPI0030D3C3EB